jgi:putative redox protein
VSALAQEGSKGSRTPGSRSPFRTQVGARSSMSAENRKKALWRPSPSEPRAQASTNSGDCEGSPLSFAAEGRRAFGGTDSAPSPLDFALGALTSCTQVTGQIVASGNPKIALGRWEVAVKANLDGAVLLKGSEGVSNFRDVDLTVSVETNLDGDVFARFTKEVEHRCPVTQLFRRSGVLVTTRWTAKPLAVAGADLTRFAS